MHRKRPRISNKSEVLSGFTPARLQGYSTSRMECLLSVATSNVLCFHNLTPNAVAQVRFSPNSFHHSRLNSFRLHKAMHSSAKVVTKSSGGLKPTITLSDKTLKHLNKMRVERNENLCLRIGVRQGGCSGMSYVMDFEQVDNMRPDDSVIDYDGFKIVCDLKSLLFLYGMQLDYSDDLIGGGFSFKNQNATSTCGYGKSFSA